MTPETFAKALADRLGYAVEHTGVEDGRDNFVFGLPATGGFNTARVWRADVLTAGPSEVRNIALAFASARRIVHGNREAARPLVFLDIDGVLNGGVSPTAREGSVLALNYITRVAGAAIVVHSSWRYTLSLEGLRGALLTMGVTGHVLDVCDTPRHQVMPDGGLIIGGADLAEWQAGAPSDHERAVAIWRWLRDHPEHDPGGRFVILDDDTSLGHYVDTEHFICTLATWPGSDAQRDGLTPAHARMAVKVLEGAS